MPNAGKNLIGIGDLAVTVDAIDTTLVGLDMYTNPNLWQASHLQVPTPTETGALQFEKPDRTGIRNYNVQPRVEEMAEAHWLRIVVSDDVPHRHVQCGDHVLAGVTTNGFLVDLWLHLRPTE